MTAVTSALNEKVESSIPEDNSHTYRRIQLAAYTDRLTNIESLRQTATTSNIHTHTQTDTHILSAIHTDKDIIHTYTDTNKQINLATHKVL